jgi:hypothetical protein
MRQQHKWTFSEEVQCQVSETYEQFLIACPDLYDVVTYNGWRFKKARLIRAHEALSDNTEPGVIFHDKPVPTFHWRDAIHVAQEMQRVAKSASQGQDFATIELDAEEEDPFLLFLSDTHIGDWATDYDAFERITDEILETPGLYVGLLGDLANMAIKLRGVAEVAGGSLFTPELQLRILEQWLDTISHKVAFATWDNHAVEREEAGTGISAFANLQKKHVTYFGGIGHPDIIAGEERYTLAVSHRFRGTSIDNPCHGSMRYLRREGHDRELAAMGDIHQAGIVKFYHGNTPKVAVNCGSTQTGSVYARRHFSLFTQPVMPGVVLSTDRHNITPYMSVGEWKSARAS